MLIREKKEKNIGLNMCAKKQTALQVCKSGLEMMLGFYQLVFILNLFR